MGKNLVASIRQRLLSLAKNKNEDFNFVLTQYVIQRFLYRLSISQYKERFLLKGAWLFSIWSSEFHRPTRDADFLGFGSNDVNDLVYTFKRICGLHADDGLVFDLDSFKGREIKEDDVYQGVRITGYSYLGSARMAIQVDVGFGDAVTPNAEIAELPSFLELPKAILKVYPVYSVIAEKFQAMVILGLANSRMKDFFDIWHIAHIMPIEGSILVQAVRATFERRSTALHEKLPIALRNEFGLDKSKQKQWEAFINKNRLQTNLSFINTINQLNLFLGPIYQAAYLDERWHKRWLPDLAQWV